MYKTLAFPNLFSAVPVSKSRSSARVHVEVSTPWLSYALIAINVVLLLWYLLGVNANASKGYELKKIQTNLSQLTEESKKLSLSISEKNSIAGMQEDFAKNDFVPAGQPKFLEIDQFSEALHKPSF